MIKFKNVSKSFGTIKALENISFEVEKGEFVYITGPSGAGKTSIADLLLRLFRPTGGTVYLDGLSADAIDVVEWRKHFGYVSQDVFLFNGTIEENIRFYRSELSQENIIEAVIEIENRNRNRSISESRVEDSKPLCDQRPEG